MVPTKEEYDQAVRSITATSKKVREFYHLNEVAFKDLILSADYKSCALEALCKKEGNGLLLNIQCLAHLSKMDMLSKILHCCLAE